ncbi:MAG: sialate O-acetylesterase [Clostridia bacterium]|nr:sialate O-acetylesterase [Clostridia bacterium]
MKIFLMIGQSNMAGRGDLKDVSPIEDPQVGVFRMGRFRRLTEPVNVDRAPVAGWVEGVTVSGISLAPSFAHALAEATGDKVGLIPCADGGTSVSEWQPGGVLLENALFQTELAQRVSPLTGILWHQGEADCHHEEQVSAYRDRFMTMYREICRRLGRDEIPVLIGGLGDFLAERKEMRLFCELNAVLRGIAEELPAAAFVPATGLASKPDHLHFNAVAQREFGVRYFEAWQALSARRERR